MKKLFVSALSLLLLLALWGCSEKEKVKFYETKTQIRHSTGDINLLEKTYDGNWNLLLSYTTLNGNFASQTEYEYSEDFTILTTKRTSAVYEPETTKVVRSFDEKGQVIQAETYTGNRHTSTTEYTYDDNGETIFVKSTHPDTGVVTTIQRIFDDHGNLVTYIQDTGFYEGRYEYSYNRKHQRIREEYYRDDTLLDYTDILWEGNVGTGTHYNADGTPTGKKILEYDDHGNLLRLEAQDLLGTTLSVSCSEYIGTDGSISSGIPE